jgi:hypothetical protein
MYGFVRIRFAALIALRTGFGASGGATALPSGIRVATPGVVPVAGGVVGSVGAGVVLPVPPV